MATQITSAESSRKRRDKGAVYQSERFGSELPNSDEDSDTECAACHEIVPSLQGGRKKSGLPAIFVRHGTIGPVQE